mmetsp:Transcript_110436/g.191346  ORF Transcript_110436/g.191346 Transcript_110436/m.191346 type:complete len:239 (-) Transcript_110436:445-1161(-)
MCHHQSTWFSGWFRLPLSCSLQLECFIAPLLSRSVYSAQGYLCLTPYRKITATVCSAQKELMFFPNQHARCGTPWGSIRAISMFVDMPRNRVRKTPMLCCMTLPQFRFVFTTKPSAAATLHIAHCLPAGGEAHGFWIQTKLAAQAAVVILLPAAVSPLFCNTHPLPSYIFVSVVVSMTLNPVGRQEVSGAPGQNHPWISHSPVLDCCGHGQSGTGRVVRGKCNALQAKRGCAYSPPVP